jgi:hypothetical protein
VNKNTRKLNRPAYKSESLLNNKSVQSQEQTHVNTESQSYIAPIYVPKSTVGRQLPPLKSAAKLSTKKRTNTFKIPNVDPSKIAPKEDIPSNKKDQIIKKLDTLQHELKNIINQNENPNNKREGYLGRGREYEKLQRDINRITSDIEKYNKVNPMSNDDFKDLVKEIETKLEKIEGFRYNRTRMPRIFSQGPTMKPGMVTKSGPKIMGMKGKIKTQIAGKHRTRKNRK